MRKTKIVATVGPSSQGPEVMRAMLQAGVNVLRVNCSHGTPDEHSATVHNARRVARDAGRSVALMFDTRGPEVRIQGLEAPILLEPDQEIVLGEGDLTVSHPGLADDVPVGARILLADGALELVALGKRHGGLRCRVLVGGILHPGKKVSVPSIALRLPVLSAEDIESLEMARALQVDYVALSFARSAQDVAGARCTLGNDGPWILAKVELAEAVNNLEELVEAADGAMVARGDLAVELDPYQVPLVQRRLVRLCNTHGKPVVVATQMLESMITQPAPTRAEVADVAAAVWDGADAVMLSAETAIGQHPVGSVEVMGRAALAAESDRQAMRIPGLQGDLVGEVPAAIAEAACRVAERARASAVICCTYSGWTARLVAAFRPSAPVVAATSREQVASRLEGIWGVCPVLIEEAQGTDELLAFSLSAARDKGLVRSGDRVVFTAGIPFLQAGTTNLVRVVQA